jgi:hypothetical protein
MARVVDTDLAGVPRTGREGITMNPRIIKLGLESGMLNYVDHETPRHYFLCGHADEECLERFAELIVRECANLPFKSTGEVTTIGEIAVSNMILKHFGVE